MDEREKRILAAAMSVGMTLVLAMGMQIYNWIG
jgi:hypothetical protein